MQTVTITTILIVKAGLTIPDPSLPEASVGVPYSHQMVAVGGTAPYGWSSSGLPSGLTMSSSGLISGTPTSAGSYSVTISVGDSSV